MFRNGRFHLVAKGLILIGLGFFAYFGLLSTSRVLERGIRAYLQKSLPGAAIEVHVGADPFWVFSGNLRKITLRISHFDASHFPIPTTGGPAASVPGATHSASQPGEGNPPAERGSLAGDVSDRGVRNDPSEGLARTLVSSGYQVRSAEDLASDSVKIEDLPLQIPAPEPGAGAASSGSTGHPNEVSLAAAGSGGAANGGGDSFGTKAAGTDPAAPGASSGMIRPARIGEIDLDLSDFTYLDQHISRFHAHIPDVEYDFGLARRKHLLKLGHSSPGTVEIGLSERDLNSAVTLDRPDVRDIHVYPEAGDLRVTLDYHTVLGWVPVAVTGQLAVVDGHAVWFVNPAISAVRVTFPQAVTDFVLKRTQNVNPVFDLDRLNLPMAVQLTSVRSTAQQVTVRGTIQIPGG